MLLALAVVLPGVFWDRGPETAPELREAGIHRVLVPAAQAGGWKSVEGFSVEVANPQQAVKLVSPGVNYRYDQASASRAPWLNSNGWRFLRQPNGRFLYDVAGPSSALAAAEAFSWRAGAMVRTDPAGLKPLAQMLAFLEGLESAPMEPVADFGFIDDGSAVAGEVMNLMTRDNLLFRIVRAPEAGLKLTVRLGTANYPLEKAKNPGVMAQMIRADLTDDRRSLRTFGTAVVVGRLEAATGKLRLHLINYDGVARKVSGMRVRVAGEYKSHKVAAAGSPGVTLLDYAVLPGATEFTLPELKTYAVIDLLR